jgi:CBS domain-containing protein
MTKDPLCCLPGDSVEQVGKLMKHADIGCVPVVASHDTKQLVGVITDRDMVLRVIAHGRDCNQTRIEAVMTPNLWVCRADDAVADAIDVMAQEQIRRILIVEDGRRIVGIISQGDIATRTDNAQQTAAVVQQISLATVAPPVN